MLSDLIKIKEQIEDKYIKTPIFLPQTPLGVKLKDQILIYNDNKKYKIVPLNVLLNFPVIFDNYNLSKVDEIGDKTVKITISTCPFTLSSVIYLDEWFPSNYVYNNNLILINKDRTVFLIQNNGESYSLTDGSRLTENNKKLEAKIMTLRDAITLYPDSVFLHLNINLEYILTPDYYINNTILYPIAKTNEKFNKFHPKTLVFGIEYFSKKNSRKKYSALIGKGSKNNKIYKKSILKNGIEKYLAKMIFKIREKGGIIIPCFWFAWCTFHPNTNIVDLKT